MSFQYRKKITNSTFGIMSQPVQKQIGPQTEQNKMDSTLIIMSMKPQM